MVVVAVKNERDIVICLFGMFNLLAPIKKQAHFANEKIRGINSFNSNTVSVRVQLEPNRVATSSTSVLPIWFLAMRLCSSVLLGLSLFCHKVDGCTQHYHNKLSNSPKPLAN